MPNNEEVTYLERLTENNANLGDVDDVTSLLPSSTTAQEQKLAQLEELLKGKAGIPQKPNVFVQTTEPSKKKGIWFQKSGDVEHYMIDDSAYTAGTWSDSTEVSGIPYYAYTAGFTAVGTDIYMFGSSTNSEQKYAYKYDTLTNTYTRLSDIPIKFNMSSVAAVGTDIYLFGGNNSPYNYTYKYDTLTDAYTKVANGPGSLGATAAVAIGTNIFLTGGQFYSNVYKYDTLANTYTRVGSVSFSTGKSGVAAVGTDLYIFGGTDSGNYSKVGKYDTTLNVFTALSDAPESFNMAAAVAVGPDIYIKPNSRSNFYKYNISSDTYTAIPGSSYITYPAEVAIGTNVYTLGESVNKCYHINSKTYELDNLVIISQGKHYAAGCSTELYDTDFDSNAQPIYWFVDAWHYTTADGLDTTSPTYYGDGTQWINFKNPPSNNN